MYPSSFRKDRLSSVAGVDRIGPAAALAQPVDPLGADDADDVGEVLPPRARPARHCDQAVQLSQPDRPLGQRMTDPCPRRRARRRAASTAAECTGFAFSQPPTYLTRHAEIPV